MLDGAATDGLAPVSQDLPGEAIYFVCSGTLISELGDTRVSLSEGDAVQSSFLARHRLRAAPGSPVELIALLTQPIDER